MMDIASPVVTNVEALKAADTALLDWLRCYSADQCNTIDVMISLERIKERGSVLAYIAHTRELIKEALDFTDVSLPDGERLMSPEEIPGVRRGFKDNVYIWEDDLAMLLKEGAKMGKHARLQMERLLNVPSHLMHLTLHGDSVGVISETAMEQSAQRALSKVDEAVLAVSRFVQEGVNDE